MKKTIARERVAKKKALDTYFSQCERCGANLDPGEKCDCEEERDDDEKRSDFQEDRVKKAGAYR